MEPTMTPEQSSENGKKLKPRLIRRFLKVPGSREMSGLALLLLLAGCGAPASLGGPHWYGQTRSATAQDLPETEQAGQHAVDVDFEVLPPQRVEELRQRGVELPRTSQGLGDPRAHQDFVDRRVTAVGFGITVGGYLLYCEGLSLPVLVPESHVDLELTNAVPVSPSIYPDRDTALADLGAQAHGSRHATYAWYRGVGGALIVPTLFSPASTPRIARTMLEIRQHLSETVQRELKVLLLTMTGTKVLQGVFARVVRMGQGVPGDEVPAPRQAATRAPAPASAPETSAPSPNSPPPSPGLVRALAGNNPTPPVAAGPRLPQDVAVNPNVPRLRETDRPISSSPSQNAQLQADIDYLESIGARNIRVNQQQLVVENRQRVGINRPDLQFDYNGRRYHVEYETPTSGRGPGHQSRTTSNDPNAEIIILIVP